MDTELLQVFVDVMRRGSFAAVARGRRVNPATISRSIQTLEQHLKLRLFQRSTRRLQPTEAGRLYFERIEPILDELKRAELSAADVSRNPSGVLRITCPVSFAQLNITPLLPKFAALYPELSFEFLLTDSTLDLIAENIDAAIRIGVLPDSSLIAHLLCPMVARVCATPEYIRRHGHPAKPLELSRHDTLVHALAGFAPSSWKFIDERGHKEDVPLQPKLRTSNAMALKQCALSHMGITLQATWMIGQELADGTLIDLFPQHRVTATTAGEAAAWVLMPSRHYTPQKTKLFVDFLKREFRDGAPGARAG